MSNQLIKLKRNSIFSDQHDFSDKASAVLCDFDGTITDKDITDELLEKFAAPRYKKIEEQWVNGEINSKSCMSQQVKLIDTSIPSLKTFLDTVTIDKQFKNFVSTAIDKKIDLYIISDGLDFVIRHILTNNQIDFIPVLANHLSYDGGGHWDISFPYSDEKCLKSSGNCKCSHLHNFRKKYQEIFYIGDGVSDYCISHNIDFIFAKNKLITYCQQNNLNHIAITDFSDVNRWLNAHYFDKITHL